MVADAVRVANEVEPEERHALAEAGRSEQAVDLPLVGVLPRVRLEGADLLRRGRQAREVEAEAADELRARGLGRGAQARLLDSRENEGVDRVSGPTRVASGGRRRSHGRDVGPVRLPLGAFRDPAPQRRDLLGREPCATALRERHPSLLVRVEQAGDERALVRRTGHDGHRARGERALRDLLAVEPQAGLAGGLVGTVAREAVLGQDRPHVAVVAEVARIARPRGRPRRQHRRPRLGHLDRHAFRPGRTGRDPAADRLDLCRVERRGFLRHPVLRIGARHLPVEQARGGIAGHHDLAGVAAFAEERLAVEPQQRLALARAVAADARRREDRQHLAHEVRRRLGCRGDARRDGTAERERGRERHDERNGKPGAAPHGQTEILSLLLARRRRLRRRVQSRGSMPTGEAHA